MTDTDKEAENSTRCGSLWLKPPRRPENSCPAHEARSRVAVDITLRCALTAAGTPQPGAARVDGAVCTRAREDARGRSRLVVVGGKDGARFMQSLAAVRVCDAQPALYHSAAMAWRRRWFGCFPVSCARSFTSSRVATPTPLHARAEPTGGPLIWQMFFALWRQF